MAEPPIDLTGRLELGGLVGVLAGASVVVSNDSGPLHLAAAAGAPCVGIFWCANLINAGRQLRSRYRPFLSWRLECPVCGTSAITGRCDHTASFVADVPVEDVAAAALELLAEGRAGPAVASSATPSRAPVGGRAARRPRGRGSSSGSRGGRRPTGTARRRRTGP